MPMVTLHTAVSTDVYNSIDAGISIGKWKTSYDFLKQAVIEKLQKEGMIK